MKKLVVAAALASLFAAGQAFAAGTSTVLVTATVGETCGFDNTNYTLAFGFLDPGTPVIVNASTQIGVRCSLNTVYTISDVQGAHQMTGLNFGGTLDYSVTGQSTGGVGTGAWEYFSFDGQVLDTAYNFASGVLPDDYEDTITLSINP